MAQFAAVIAIDWSAAQPEICLADASTGKKASCMLKHTPEALEAWATA